MDIPAGVRPHTFSLKDAEGNDHEYVVMLHPAHEGDSLAWRIQGLGVAPLVEAIKGLAQAPEVQALAGAMRGDTDAETPAEVMTDAGAGLFAALGDIDVTPLASSLQSVMAHPDLPKLAREIMKHTARDRQKLGMDTAWSTAYRGNYGEMMLAVARVIQLNDFFPVARLFGGSSITTPAA